MLDNEIEPLRQVSLDSYPTIWVVRAGEKGKEKDALDNNLVTIAWNGLENLSKITNRGELEDIYIKAYENERNKRNYKLSVNQNVGQILDFLKEIKNDDIVILPLLSKDTEFL